MSDDSIFQRSVLVIDNDIRDWHIAKVVAYSEYDEGQINYEVCDRVTAKWCSIPKEHVIVIPEDEIVWLADELKSAHAYYSASRSSDAWDHFCVHARLLV